MRHRVIIEDCARALGLTQGLWAHVENKRIFLTGGTGFFGLWFLELLTYAADEVGFDCEVTVLTRQPNAFLEGPARHLAVHRCVRLVMGDVRDFAFPRGHFDSVVHFGSTGSKAFQESDPEGFFDLIVLGTKRILTFAEHAGATRVLLASTGAVYGPNHESCNGGLSEDYVGGPDVMNPSSANAEGKRVAEFLTSCWTRRKPGRTAAIARGFAFVGPYLSKDAGFAASDFLHAVRTGRDVIINGDGTPLRSYLYGADLAVWLWTILLGTPAGTARAWNVGGEHPVSICELANMAAALISPAPVVRILGKTLPGQRAQIYLPNTARARTELGLAETIPLAEALQRTLSWLET